VIGGGAVAEQKVLGLLAAGAHVTVVSPETTPRLADLAAAGEIDLRRRPYRSGDLAGARLAIAGPTMARPMPQYGPRPSERACS